jgi:hypothetical protein
MRDHIEFIQTQRLAWQDGASWGRPGTRLKLLSRDHTTGAFSCVMQFPAGWSGGHSAWLAVDEEFYVLDGRLVVDGVAYTDNSYGHWPAGFEREDATTPDGATLLCFFSGQIDQPTTVRPEVMQARLVRKVDVTDGQWDGDLEKFGLASMKARSRMRVLREDPLTGETTYLTATSPFLHGVRAERHPIVQEFYLLSGELAGNTGIMQAGAYCFRPEMVKHGPYGSPTGALILFRGMGGKQETFWEDAPPFTFKPDHAPILPTALQPLGAAWPRPDRY